MKVRVLPSWDRDGPIVRMLSEGQAEVQVAEKGKVDAPPLSWAAWEACQISAPNAT